MIHMPSTNPRHDPNRKNPTTALSVQTLLLGQNPKNDVTFDLIIFIPWSDIMYVVGYFLLIEFSLAMNGFST